jgi:hypothetical protein
VPNLATLLKPWKSAEYRRNGALLKWMGGPRDEDGESGKRVPSDWEEIAGRRGEFAAASN